tara:strand:- start:26717 stop:27226 length:510 start_codon:yes stop_codon:yes gene_type:complete
VDEEEQVDASDIEVIENDRLEELEHKISSLEKELQYQTADMANLRQKSAKERSEAIRYGSSSLARKILPLLSGMEKAISQKDGPDGDGFIEGTKNTIRGLRTALESEGVIHIEAIGNKFDPTKMEAIAMLPAPVGVEPGCVMEVIEEGYMLHERVLIASKVIVADMAEE